MDDAHRLRHSLAITQNNVAIGRSSRIAQAFELETREYIWQLAIAVIAHASRVEHVIVCGKDDIADLHIDKLILLLEIDRTGRAELFR